MCRITLLAELYTAVTHYTAVAESTAVALLEYDGIELISLCVAGALLFYCAVRCTLLLM